ncbi:hypothetical protein [Pseudorhodoplanes sinuspersici]|uniref:hypothetical protein n=1 Tax=Pseudorhodoplanes sinuspersici TaxID=1235591 RepID=UPI001FDA5D6A|nr:hypothetical protein [Pseudorhodoplanes sinuspersici]
MRKQVQDLAFASGQCYLAFIDVKRASDPRGLVEKAAQSVHFGDREASRNDHDRGPQQVCVNGPRQDCANVGIPSVRASFTIIDDDYRLRQRWQSMIR